MKTTTNKTDTNKMENTMQTLTGSEKQIKWATEIRNSFYAEKENVKNLISSKIENKTDTTDKTWLKYSNIALNWIFETRLSSDYWIDQRNKNLYDLALHVALRVKPTILDEFEKKYM